MNSVIMITAGISGLVLGLFYFGGLWVGLKAGLKSRNPAAVFLLSFVIRISVVLLSFYLLVTHHWMSLLVCIPFFLAGRFIITKYLVPDAGKLSGS